MSSPDHFSKSRVESFSDGVMAVIITIMVLDLKAPESADPGALFAIWPSFAIYLVSFCLTMIYWINHHGLIAQARRVTARLLWANGAILFSASLIPFATAYVARTALAPFPTAIYAALQCACGVAFNAMFHTITLQRDDEAFRARARVQRRRNYFAVTIYAAAAVLAHFHPVVAILLFAAVSLAYVTPRSSCALHRPACPAWPARAATVEHVVSCDMDAARRLATYDDLSSLPAELKGEVVRGVLVTLPAPLPRHSRVQGALRSLVGKPFDDDDGRGGPGGWWVLLEVDVRLATHEIVRPDLSGWRRERLVEPWDQRPIDVRPDWICEVLSPSNAAHDRITKRHLYAEHGVPHYWMVDPEARTLEALALRDGIWVDAGSFDDTATARIPPFEAIELEVGRLFPPR